MNYRERNQIIEAICKDSPLFIRDTAIRVKIDYFGSDMSDFRNRNKKDEGLYCRIEFLDPPTSKVMKLMRKYDFKRNSHSNKMELEGVICIDHLSTVPRNSRAGKLLYGKT